MKNSRELCISCEYYIIQTRIAERGLMVKPRGKASCPNCASDRFIVETALFLDLETDEVDDRELQCIDCSYIWEQWPNKPVQTGVGAFL